MATVIALNEPLHKPNILLVEDSISDAILIRKALVKALPGGCHVRSEVTLEAALKALSEEEFNAALLDLSLPDSTELDGLISIQNFAPKLPVIILTAYADEDVALKAVERGAQDYLFKDTSDGQVIRRAMQYAIQRKQFEGALIKQANFDPMTGLANRALFESRLDMALARIKRSSNGVGVFFLDLNRFKQVNDTLGHAAGDKLLLQVAERLKQCIRPYDTAARFGGDEFALLIEGIAIARDCAAIAQKVIGHIAEPFRIGERGVEVGVSIGIVTCFAWEKSSRETLMRHADEAMYGAKLSLHSNYRFYTKNIHEQASTRLKLEEDLRTALVNGELALHYQPKIDLHSGRTSGAEALARWNHPTRGMLLPAEFIAVAQETGLSQELCEWVFTTVCDDIVRWRASGLSPVQVSVNITTEQLDDPALPPMLRALLAEHDVSGSLIAVEVPSSALLERTQTRMKALSSLRDLGVGVHLDHFGASAISLASLKNLAVDVVKIAPELTKSLEGPDGMLPLVQAIMDIAERFNVGVVAAGIENEWQRAYFKKTNRCDGQGFALCPPVSSANLRDWLAGSGG